MAGHIHRALRECEHYVVGHLHLAVLCKSPHPSSPRWATGSLPGVALGQATSAGRPGQRRTRCRPALSRPFLLKSSMAAPPAGAGGAPSRTLQTVTASCASCGRSRYCARHGTVMIEG